jgi:hypothetical protein
VTLPKTGLSSIGTLGPLGMKEEEEELQVQGRPSVNEVSFRARPHRNVHNTLGVDIGATGPRWRVDSIEGGGIGRRGEKNGEIR